mmetsp:Transcript_105612/g.325745  ORF Transcript_105612/g.325745 Transcript_105612/m.325745 type:complete len:351 (+) Transcript_105612:371-1423(+)
MAPRQETQGTSDMCMASSRPPETDRGPSRASAAAQRARKSASPPRSCFRRQGTNPWRAASSTGFVLASNPPATAPAAQPSRQAHCERWKAARPVGSVARCSARHAAMARRASSARVGSRARRPALSSTPVVWCPPRVVTPKPCSSSRYAATSEGEARPWSSAKARRHASTLPQLWSAVSATGVGGSSAPPKKRSASCTSSRDCGGKSPPRSAASAASAGSRPTSSARQRKQEKAQATCARWSGSMSRILATTCRATASSHRESRKRTMAVAQTLLASSWQVKSAARTVATSTRRRKRWSSFTASAAKAHIRLARLCGSHRGSSEALRSTSSLTACRTRLSTISAVASAQT